MPSYSDYIKGGEVLIAPTLDYKEQFILKCQECEYYYEQLDSFVSHCLGHFQAETNEEYWYVDELHHDEESLDVKHDETITTSEDITVIEEVVGIKTIV